MSACMIAQIRIRDRDGYRRYEAGFEEVFAKFPGELLVISEDPTVVEGEWPCTRTVLIRFPTAEDARRWYQSPEYQAIARHRFDASECNAVLVEGLPPQ